MATIHFKINYEVRQKRKFEKFLNLYENEIGFRLLELNIERYWKIEEQFQANFYIETETNEKEKRIYEVLVLANKLWTTGDSNWTINGPYESQDLKFECFLNNHDDNQPLKWAHIELEEI